MTPIVVNGREVEVMSATLSYEDIVNLAYARPPKHLLTVTYHMRGTDGWEKNGSLLPGQSVSVSDGADFTAVSTSNA
jgi:hypothetical protein